MAARLADPLLAELPWVRRSTGGATLVHDRELTYALALPPNLAARESWMPRMHAIIVAALASLGVHVDLVRESAKTDDVLCFQQHTVGDVLSDGQKVVGSAQRRHRRCLLQHGAILVRRSSATPRLPGLFETTSRDVKLDALAAAIVESFPLAIEAEGWTADELRRIEALVRDKYDSPAWNERR